MNKTLQICLILSFCPLFFASSAKEAENGKISIMFLGLDNKQTSANEINGVSALLSVESPDIAIFAEVKDKETLNSILSKNPSYRFSFFSDAGKPKHLALISKIAPDKCSLIEKKYKIDEKEVSVLRGFIAANFAIGNYKFTLIGAHLKNAEPHPEFNQFDMRRYEARQLRYIFDEIREKDPAANVVIVGNMNDTCDMSTIKEIYYRRYAVNKRLFDIRPLDDLRTSWTHWNAGSDEYERTSYAFANFAILPELIREETKIVRTKQWLELSTHRPVFLKFSTEDKEEYSKDYIAAIYPNSIYSEIAERFEEDKNVGEKLKRKPPQTDKPKK
jgi:hypothetical protein